MDTVTFSMEQINQLLDGSFMLVFTASLLALFCWDVINYFFGQLYCFLKDRHHKRKTDLYLSNLDDFREAAHGSKLRNDHE